MAKKDRTGLIVGLAVAGVAGYLLLKRPAAPAATAPTVAPAVPGGTAAPPANTTAGLLYTLINLGKSIFGGNSGPSFAPVSTAPTRGATTTPAGGISYINPTAPTLQLPSPAYSDTTSYNLSDYGLDLFS